MDFVSTGALSSDVFDVVRSEAETLPVTSHFEQRAGRLSALSQAKSTEAIPAAITEKWGAIARANMTVQMYENLNRLANSPNGWAGPNSRALDASAIGRFLSFWQLVKDDAAEPTLTLAPDGSLVAEWFKSETQRLDVRYSPRSVIFGLMTPKNILEGAESGETVAAILKVHPQKPLQWHERT